MSERKPYKTDLSDAQRALIEPVIAAWKTAHRSVSGHQGRYEMREIVNALLYQGRTECQWDLLPHDLPPRGAVMYYFTKWRDDGTDQTIHDLLRWQVREKARRKADPSLVVLDTESVHAAAGVPAQSTGRDAAKNVPGRKRGLAVTCWAWRSQWWCSPRPVVAGFGVAFEQVVFAVPGGAVGNSRAPSW
ncbi:transposase [Streptomyces canus]|nr:transposase [Streptomyces canus]